MKGDHDPILLNGEFGALQRCGGRGRGVGWGGEAGQECMNPHSHLLELLLLLSQEVGPTWLRHLVHLFSQHDQQGSTGLSTH